MYRKSHPINVYILFLILQALFASCSGGTSTVESGPPEITSLFVSSFTENDPVLIVNAEASRLTGSESIAFYIGEVKIGEDLSPPFGLTANIGYLHLTAGTYLLSGVLLDGKGRVLSTLQQTFEVLPANGSTPVTLTFLSPLPNEVLSGNRYVSVSGTAPLSSVRFFVDQTLTIFDESPPFGFSLDTTRYDNGEHILTASASLTDGRLITANLSVFFQNATPRPGARIVSPPANSTLSNHVVVRVEGVEPFRRVLFFLDNDKLFEDREAPFEFVLDTRNYPNGTHYISVTAEYYQGEPSQDVVQVLFSNPNPPPPPPPGENPIQLDSPEEGAILSGTVEVKVSVSSSFLDLVKEVEFFIDGEKIYEDHSAPFSYYLNTSFLSNGPHQLLILAEFQQDYKAYASVSFQIQN